MNPPSTEPLVRDFLNSYPASEKDRIWQTQSQQLRDFFEQRILIDSSGTIPDEECDVIIRILDRNGKGNTKESEAVAKAMIPQGAWRRIFNEFHTNQTLGKLVHSILEEQTPEIKAKLIDEMYRLNAGQKNNLTGPSGNMISAFLAAYDPIRNISIISLKDRQTLLNYLEPDNAFDWDTASIGEKIVLTNDLLKSALKKTGLEGSARTLSVFCYRAAFKSLWKGDAKVKRPEKSVNVTVPETEEPEPQNDRDETIDESKQIQALLSRIGASMGYSIWLPKADRGRVLKAWKPQSGELLDDLPLGYDPTTMKTIEQIDVLWIKRRSIIRAFEVEHTTSIYSGILRMADLVALQPNINIHLHIVAPDDRRDKVKQEIQRPVFSLLEGRALAEMCTYISYSNVQDIGELKHLPHMSDMVLEDYQEYALDEDDG